MKKLSMATLLLGLGMTQVSVADYVAPNITHDPFMRQQVVYQMNTADVAEQAQTMRYVKNHLATLGKDNGEIQVVVFGPGISLLSSEDEKLNADISALRAQGVKFAVCNNTLKAKNIDFHQLHQVTEQDIVPSGVVEVVFLQQRGFTYFRP